MAKVHKSLKVYLRSCKEYVEWRKFILHEAGGKCWISGSVSKLEVHHLDHNFASILKEVLQRFPGILPNTRIGFIPANELAKVEGAFFAQHKAITGVPISKGLHKLFHKQYGKYCNTKEQLQQFKNDYLASKGRVN